MKPAVSDRDYSKSKKLCRKGMSKHMKIPSERPKIGDKVVFSKKIVRHRMADSRITWIEMSCDDTTGFYIGYRFKQAGYTKYYTDEYPEWHMEKAIPCAAVVVNERENPIAVPFGSLRSA